MAKNPIDLFYAFGLSPEAAVDFFRSKDYAFSWRWTDTWQDAHHTSFTVAKVMKHDILEDIRKETDRAINDGTTFAEFKKNLIPLLQEKGWWGRKPVSEVPAESGVSISDDPKREVTLGTPRRLKTIYRTNLQTAYSLGRSRFMLDNAGMRPWWAWVAILDRRTRASHKNLDYTVSGKVFRFDDKIWKTMIPPIDWGCRCRIRAFSDDDLKRYGLKPSDDHTVRMESRKMNPSDPESADIKVAVYRDMRVKVEAGKGWSYDKMAGYKPELKGDSKAIKTQVEKEVNSLSNREFPTGLAGLKKIRSLGGSTGAVLYEDSSGNQFVVKSGANPDHIREEAQADAIYRSLGIAVPEFQLFESPTGTIKIARYIRGQHLGELRKQDPKAFEAALAKLRSDFAADALIGNWDVVGLDEDNIVVDEAGVPFRIDNGGSLRYRAQGQKKSRFDEYTDDLWSMRNQSLNSKTHSIFGGLGYEEIIDQVGKIVKRENDVLKAITDPELKKTVSARFETLKELAALHHTFKTDQWKDEYTDNFSSEVINLRIAGISGRFPTELATFDPKHPYLVRDKNNQNWDHLRGQNSIVSDFANYVNSNGGNYKIIEDWMSSQGNSSTNPISMNFGYFFATQRKVNPDSSYHWPMGLSKVKESYDTLFKKKDFKVFNRTITAYHAFNYEFLRKVKFANNENGFVRLMRTESASVMSHWKFNDGDRDCRMPRKVLESTSIYQRVSVGGHEVTVQMVPHHRVFGTYFQERKPGTGGVAFYSDRENEFVCLLEGIPFHYNNGYKPKR